MLFFGSFISSSVVSLYIYRSGDKSDSSFSDRYSWYVRLRDCAIQFTETETGRQLSPLCAVLLVCGWWVIKFLRQVSFIAILFRACYRYGSMSTTELNSERPTTSLTPPKLTNSTERRVEREFCEWMTVSMRLGDRGVVVTIVCGYCKDSKSLLAILMILNRTWCEKLPFFVSF